MNDIFHIHGDIQHTQHIVWTCEHATNRVPAPLVPRDNDVHWLNTHWGYDIGIEMVTRALVERTQTTMIASRFSRLVCDPNRDPEDATLILQEVEDQPIHFNAHVDAHERQRRLQRHYDPYHHAIDRLLAQRRPPTVLISMHSFTRCYKGQPRSMEMGLMFDDGEDAAAHLGHLTAKAGFDTALNEPYSGKDGLFFSAQRHGRQHGVPHIQIEIRQDLIDTQEKAGRVADRLRPAFKTWARAQVG